jgi:hypothetical protein
MDAFVSHSSEDAEFAIRLVALLEHEGIKCWIAPRDIPGGDEYASAILQALSKARCVALVFTEHANKSPHVLREIERAINFRTPIIPLSLEDFTPTGSFAYLLATLHWVCANDHSGKDAVAVFAAAVKQRLDRSANSQGHDWCAALSDYKEAHDTLWSLCRDIELGYRRAMRKDLSPDDWSELGAKQVVLNELLIANSRHYSAPLQSAAQAYEEATRNLANHLHTFPDSRPSEDFAKTSVIFLDKSKPANDAHTTELQQKVWAFELARREFEFHFQQAVGSRNRMPSILSRIFGTRSIRH